MDKYAVHCLKRTGNSIKRQDHEISIDFLASYVLTYLRNISSHLWPGELVPADEVVLPPHPDVLRRDGGDPGGGDAGPVHAPGALAQPAVLVEEALGAPVVGVALGEVRVASAHVSGA